MNAMFPLWSHGPMCLHCWLVWEWGGAKSFAPWKFLLKAATPWNSLPESLAWGGQLVNRIAGNFQGRKTFMDWWEVSILWRVLSRNAKPIINYRTVWHAQNFVKRTFMGSAQTVQFVKVFSLKRLPQYSIPIYQTRVAGRLTVIRVMDVVSTCQPPRLLTLSLPPSLPSSITSVLDRLVGWSPIDSN